MADIVALVGHLAWPSTVILGLSIFYFPVSRLLDTIARRLTRLSAFKVTIELGQLSRATTLESTIEHLKADHLKALESRDPLNMTLLSSSTESGMAAIAGLQSGAADYVVVRIRND